MNQLSNNKLHNDEQLLSWLFVENCCDCFNLDYKNIVIEKTESPDFVLCDGNNYVGLEITRALDQNLQKAESIRDKKYKDVSYCPAIFEGKNMGSKEIERLLEKPKNNLVVGCYVGNGLEEKIVFNVIKSIKNKIKKFYKYKIYERNVLLVHLDNRVTLNHDFVISRLKEYILEENIQFDYICLKLEDLFHFFSKDRYFTCTIRNNKEFQRMAKLPLSLSVRHKS